MIIFDARKLGGYAVFFHVRGSALFDRHSLPHAIFSGALAAFFGYQQFVNNWLSDHILDSTAYFGGVSFIVGFVVVYRVQIAYERYKDAQKSYFDMTSKLHDVASHFNAYLLGNDDVSLAIRSTLIRWVRAYHDLALQELQGIEFNVKQHQSNLTEDEAILLSKDRKRNIQITTWITRLIMEHRHLFKCGDPFLSRSFQIITNANLFFNSARRISETPFPFPFVQLTLFMIHAWMILTPVVLGTFYPRSYAFGPAISFCSTWILFAVNEIAGQLESPFEEAANDLPLMYYTLAFEDDMSSIQYMDYPEFFSTLDDSMENRTNNEHISAAVAHLMSEHDSNSEKMQSRDPLFELVKSPTRPNSLLATFSKSQQTPLKKFHGESRKSIMAPPAPRAPSPSSIPESIREEDETEDALQTQDIETESVSTSGNSLGTQGQIHNSVSSVPSKNTAKPNVFELFDIQRKRNHSEDSEASINRAKNSHTIGSCQGVSMSAEVKEALRQNQRAIVADRALELSVKKQQFRNYVRHSVFEVEESVHSDKFNRGPIARTRSFTESTVSDSCLPDGVPPLDDIEQGTSSSETQETKPSKGARHRLWSTHSTNTHQRNFTTHSLASQRAKGVYQVFR